MSTWFLSFLAVFAVSFAPGLTDHRTNFPKRRLKVLVFPIASGWSHFQFNGRIADTLAEAGHEVHFLHYSMNAAHHASLPSTTKSVHKLHRFSAPVPFNFTSKLSYHQRPFDGTFNRQFLFQSTIWRELVEYQTAFCKEILQNDAFVAQMEAEHFDVALSEMYSYCPFALFHRVGVRTKMGTLATPLSQLTAALFGVPTFSSYVTNLVATMPSAPRMGFLERAVNFANDLYEWLFLRDLPLKLQQPILDSVFGPSFPPLKQIVRNISLVFVNSNQFTELPRPLSHKLVNIGGIVKMTARGLDADMQRIFDRSRSGVVFVSFGSLAEIRRMDPALREAFMRAFARFVDVDFVWKYDLEGSPREQLLANRSNIHFIKWADQRAILLHPKLRLFVSHCGLNSLNEAVEAGVPLLAIPLFYDQFQNAMVARARGTAEQLSIRELAADPKGAEQLIAGALEKLLFDPNYRANALVAKRKFQRTPFSPEERVTRWVEFAAEFGDLNELNLPSEEELGLLAYYSADVVLFSCLLVSASILALFRLAKATFKLLTVKQKAN